MREHGTRLPCLKATYSLVPQISTKRKKTMEQRAFNILLTPIAAAMATLILTMDGYITGSLLVALTAILIATSTTSNKINSGACKTA